MANKHYKNLTLDCAGSGALGWVWLLSHLLSHGRLIAFASRRCPLRRARLPLGFRDACLCHAHAAFQVRSCPSLTLQRRLCPCQVGLRADARRLVINSNWKSLSRKFFVNLETKLAFRAEAKTQMDLMQGVPCGDQPFRDV